MNSIEAAALARQEYFETRYRNVKPAVEGYLKGQDAIAVNEANVHSISKFLTEHHQQATDQTIQQAIKALGSSLAPKPVPVPLEGQELRDHLEAKILELLVASPAERERERASYHARLSMTRDELQSKRHTGPYLVTTQSMLQRLANLIESKRLRSLSHEQLKSEVASKKKVIGYAPLPSNFTPFNLSELSGEQIAALIQKHGVDAMNAKIAEFEAKGDKVRTTASFSNKF